MTPNIRKMLLYILIGMVAASLDFGLFYTLRQYCGLPLFVANTSGVCFGIAFSFFVNRKINFKVLDHVGDRFFRFAVVALGGLAASNLLVHILILKVDADFAKVISILIVGGSQFLANSVWTFPHEQRPGLVGRTRHDFPRLWRNGRYESFWNWGWPG
jgi:putative flippase GtrA